MNTTYETADGHEVRKIDEGTFEIVHSGVIVTRVQPVLIAAAQRAVGKWAQWWGEWLSWRKDMKGNDPARFHIVRIICVFRGHRGANVFCRRCHKHYPRAG